EEYAKESIRGKSELTLDPKASKDGLSEEYAFEYSYGVGESFTLLIPNFNGGASAGALSKNSETYKFLQERNVPNANQIIKQLPLYWGDQAFTAGPIYFGAIVLFLFILGFFIVQRKEKWWILATVVLTLALSWGKNFLFLSDFFFNHFPYYNKFRAVSSILTVTSLLVPLMAAFAVEEIINTKENSKVLLKKVRNAFFVVGGLALLFAVMPGLAGSFINETRDKASFGESYEQLINAISADRESLLRMDALRSFAFILIGAGLLYAFISKKIKSNYLLIGLALTITIDMWAVDKRYLNNDNFGKKVKNLDTEVPPNAVDLEIMKDPAMYYRVYNLTVNPFTDGNTSRYHKSIGGYHAAKLKRYQELIENQISKGNMNVLSMLNTKYFITAPQGSNQAIPQINQMACGNAWFINDIKYVANADSEMLALTNFDPKQTVFIDQRFKERVGAMNLKKDSSANIALTYYSPDTLNYTSNTAAESFAVFSEIYYEKGWNAYVDGQKTDHIRVNYVLRGMKIPAGKHEVSFRFEPANYFLGEKIAGVSSILLLLLVAGNLFMAYKKNTTNA
ncbi:MAG: YfhO family protein, partial [Sphingobacteriaceae bacterium]